MKKQHLTPTLFVSLIVILGGIGLSACASAALAQQAGGLQAQVNAAVADTLAQQPVGGQAAAQSVALAAEPAVQVQAALPTPTTAAAIVVAQATTAAPAAAASGPKIIADQNTNCRAGPSTRYAILTWFIKGAESTVAGRDAGKDWWYIASPDEPGEFCWVWDGSTTVVGDTSTLPVVDPPAGVKTKNSPWIYGWNGYVPFDCEGYPYNWCEKKSDWCHGVFCVPNLQGCDEDSWWVCNVYGYCTCNPLVKNPYKSPNCPAVTEVNYKKYCDNYPQCCE